MSLPNGGAVVLRSTLHHEGGVREVRSDGWLSLFLDEGFAAAIFDCDGTLVESAGAHMKAMQAAAADQGFDMAPDWYHARTGLDRRSLFQAFAATVPSAFDVERAVRTSIARFGGFAQLVEPKADVLRFATDLKGRGVPMAVATNAEHDVAQLCLASVGAAEVFEQLISVSDGVAPKPSPQMFLLAAARLGVSRNRALVFEDSPQGVAAALGAGMSVVQIM